MKRLAIMQPYFLPYIGYFQLMAAVDKFVLLDDVSYINRGWINRNRLLLNGEAHTFTVPLQGASQNKLICEIKLDDAQNWRKKLLRTIQHAYANAPGYKKIFSLVDRLVNYPTQRLDEFLLNSLREIAAYLELNVQIENTSRVYENAHLKGRERILDICRRECADVYINPIGGVDLYGRASFAEHGMALYFLRSHPIGYVQGKGEFVPWLSILDVLMFNEPSDIQRLLTERDLI